MECFSESDPLTEVIRKAIAKAVQEHFPDPANTPPGPVLGALAATSGALLAQLHHTPDAEERFCALVRRNAKVQRSKHLS